ncbi:hypothetical protein L204_105098 [Cryptococcus depauperatus]
MEHDPTQLDNLSTRSVRPPAHTATGDGSVYGAGWSTAGGNSQYWEPRDDHPLTPGLYCNGFTFGPGKTGKLDAVASIIAKSWMAGYKNPGESGESTSGVSSTPSANPKRCDFSMNRGWMSTTIPGGEV